MLTNSTASFKNASFTNHLAWSGGVIFFNGPNNLTMEDLTVSNCESFGDGGFMSVIDPDDKINIIINGTVSIRNVASRLQNAGAFYLNAPKANLSILGAA